MELRHLRYFVAVADELNFRKAAERLHVTRPALSKQIKDLEEETGVKLLQRDTVRVALTDAGSVFLEEARSVLADVERAVRLAREAQDGKRGQLRIGSVGQIAAGFLPEALKSFRASFPDVEIVFMEMTPPEQLAALDNGRIHIGFGYGSAADGQDRFGRLLLLRSPYGVSISRDHPFARRKALKPTDLAGRPLLCIADESSSGHGATMRAILEKEGVTPGPMQPISGFDSLLTMIAADQGISLLPIVLDLSQSHGIDTLPLTLSEGNGDFFMWAVWRKDGESRLVRNFIRILRNHLRQSETDREGNAASPVPTQAGTIRNDRSASQTREQIELG